MKMKLFDPVDIAVMNINKYQNSTANIVVKAKIDKSFQPDEIDRSASALVNKHPYLRAKFYEINSDNITSYFYEEIGGHHNLVTIHEVTDSFLNRIMDSLSSLRNYVFDNNAGELFKIHIYNGNTSCVVEFSISHIVGEVASILIIFGDFLRALSGEKILGRNRRYIFNQDDFSKECQGDNIWPLKSVSFGENRKNENINPWKINDAYFRRNCFPLEFYKSIQKSLKEQNISAKPADVLYLAAYKSFKNILGKDPYLWLILNYRKTAINSNIDTAIYNFAIGCPVDYSKINFESKGKWLESLNLFRKRLLSFDCINKYREHCIELDSLVAGIDIENGFLKMNSSTPYVDIAINNFGNIEKYLGNFRGIRIIDIDIQDGSHMQEIRCFTYQDKIHLNPMIFSNRCIDIDEFWTLFMSNCKNMFSSR